VHNLLKRQKLSSADHWARGVIVTLILGLQVWGIARGRVEQDRYFCWAPYDTFTEYDVHVRGAEGWLDADEVARRYRIPKSGRDNRFPEHVIDVFRQYEETYGRKNPVIELRLNYRINGGAEQTWNWPEAR